MDRDIRRLSHHKGNKIEIISNAPLPSEGTEGDMKLYTTGIGSILYVKGKGRWFKFKPTEGTDDGWHGSTTKIRLLAHQFRSGITTATGLEQLHPSYGYLAVMNNRTDNILITNVAIPIGYIPTAIRIYGIEAGSVTNPNVAVRVQSLSGMGAGTEILASSDWDSERALSGINKGHDDSYLQISVTGLYGESNGTAKHFLRGGYIRLAPVITAQKIAERAPDEDVLGRGL